MKTISILALAAPVAAFTTQNNVARQSTTQISETKVRCVALRCAAVDLESLESSGQGRKFKMPCRLLVDLPSIAN